MSTKNIKKDTDLLPTSFRLSNDVKQMLKILAASDNRTAANWIENQIRMEWEKRNNSSTKEKEE